MKKQENLRELRVLLVEGQSSQLSFKQTLQKVQNVLLRVESAELSIAGLARLDRGDIDAVVLNHSLREELGLSLLSHIRSQFPHVPVVVATEHGDDDSIIAAFQHGAEDYVVKGHGDSDFLGRTLHFARRASTLRLQSA